ncbi:MAG: hypothetical protein Q8N99_01130 [Nanoarchaeota archaeon]|nr:hypothetical protein [Nanoarchaeota archaeon]
MNNGIVSKENPLVIISPKSPEIYLDTEIRLYRPLAKKLIDQVITKEEISILKEKGKGIFEEYKLPFLYTPYTLLRNRGRPYEHSRLLEAIRIGKNKYGLELLGRDLLDLDKNALRDYIKYRYVRQNVKSEDQAKALKKMFEEWFKIAVSGYN